MRYEQRRTILRWLSETMPAQKGAGQPDSADTAPGAGPRQRIRAEWIEEAPTANGGGVFLCSFRGTRSTEEKAVASASELTAVRIRTSPVLTSTAAMTLLAHGETVNDEVSVSVATARARRLESLRHSGEVTRTWAADTVENIHVSLPRYCPQSPIRSHPLVRALRGVSGSQLVATFVSATTAKRMI